MYRIAVIPGDGIGPEVIAHGIKVLEKSSKKCNFELEFTYIPWGVEHYLKTGEIFPDNALENLKPFSAIYLGAIGDPRVPIGLLERGILLGLRRGLDLYANLRPMKLYHERYTPLKNVTQFDILVVRENTEDAYAGPSSFLKKHTPDEMALSLAFYSKKGVERIIRYAFEAAMQRKKKLTLCDKANAIPAHEIWQETFQQIGKNFPEVTQEMIYVDACAMALVRRPQDFDVIVTTNMFGDILTDLGTELCGGIGLGPSANIHPGKHGVFEPIHGSAPKHAGKNKANPIGAILTGAMLLDYLGEKKGSTLIETAVATVLQSGKIASLGSETNIGADEIATLILSELG